MDICLKTSASNIAIADVQTDMQIKQGHGVSAHLWSFMWTVLDTCNGYLNVMDKQILLSNLDHQQDDFLMTYFTLW